MAAVPSIGRASLVEAPARASQAAATEGLYERHSAKILGYCLHQLGSREEAEDAVQTTFMNAFRALGRGVVPESESAWLFKIAENVCLSRRRSSWRRGRIESPSDFDVIEEIVPGPSRQRDELIGIEDALAGMPEQQRRAILLREWQGLSYREIAEELEVSQSAVETLIFRARRSLAQGLEQPELTKKPKRKSFRRALHIVDLGTIVAAAKTLLAGSAAVKATAAAVAVTAAAGTAASVKVEGHSPQPAADVPVVVATPAAKAGTSVPVAGAVDSAPVVPRVRPSMLTPPRRAIRARIAEAKAAAKPAKAATKRVARSAPAPIAAPVAPAPAVEPVAPAPSEPASPPVVEPGPPAPAAEPKAAEPTPERPKPAEPKSDEPRAKNKPAHEKRRGPKKEPAPQPEPVVEEPAAIVLPPPGPPASPDVMPAEVDKQQGKKKRELAVVPIPEPVVESVEPAPAEATEAAPSPEPAAAEPNKGRGRRP